MWWHYFVETEVNLLDTDWIYTQPISKIDICLVQLLGNCIHLYLLVIQFTLFKNVIRSLMLRYFYVKVTYITCVSTDQLLYWLVKEIFISCAGIVHLLFHYIGILTGCRCQFFWATLLGCVVTVSAEDSCYAHVPNPYVLFSAYTPLWVCAR
jgi:hypothetical protein